MCMVKLPSKLQRLVGSMKSKNYSFHIVVFIFLPGSLKINMYKGQSESNASCLSPYIPLLWE